MSIFVDPTRTQDYILKEQRELPKAEQVTFKLRALSASAYADLQDAIQGSDGIKWGTYTHQMVSRGLAGWSGGKAPKFAKDDAGLVSGASMDCLSATARTELAAAIDKLNSTSDEDSKNSPAS